MMVVVLTSYIADCQGLIISVLSLASYVWRQGLFMMNILSYVLNLYWLMKVPLSAVSVSIMMLLTVDLSFSISFQAFHACADMIFFGHMEKFLFTSFSHYSLVVRTHMGWHVWHVFFVVISFVPPYCATTLLTCVIRHTCSAVYWAMPTFTSRCQSVSQILCRFIGYSLLAS